MNALREIIAEYAPKRLHAWLGVEAERQLTPVELAARVDRAAAVARLLGQQGWAEIEKAWETQDRLWLEQLVQPQTHEQYLEARGAVRGLRQAREIVKEILTAGEAAESELIRRQARHR